MKPRRSIPFDEALRDEESLGRALVELGIAIPNEEGGPFHKVVINGEEHSVFKIPHSVLKPK